MSSRTVVDWLRVSAENQPNETALQFGRNALSYADLNTATSHLANALHATGFHHGDTAFVWAPHSPHDVIAQLGVWKAGGAVVAAAEDLSVAAVAHLLKHSEANTAFVLSNHYLDFKRARGLAKPRRVIVCRLLDYLSGWDNVRFRLSAERRGGHRVHHDYTDLRWVDMLKLGAKAPAPNVTISAETVARIDPSGPVTHAQLHTDWLRAIAAAQTIPIALTF